MTNSLLRCTLFLLFLRISWTPWPQFLQFFAKVWSFCAVLMDFPGTLTEKQRKLYQGVHFFCCFCGFYEHLDHNSDVNRLSGATQNRQNLTHRIVLQRKRISWQRPDVSGTLSLLYAQPWVVMSRHSIADLRTPKEFRKQKRFSRVNLYICRLWNNL